MRKRIENKRVRIVLSLEPETFDRLDAWRVSQEVPPARIACIETAIVAWLDSLEKKPALTQIPRTTRRAHG